MVCRVAQPSIEKKSVTLLYRNEITREILSFSQAFEQSGHPVQFCAFGESLPAGQDIIAFLELESPFFNEISQPDFEKWMKIATSLDTASLLWLTRPCSMDVKDPRYAQTIGFGRTLRSEKHASFHTLEIDDITHPKSPEKAVQVYEQIAHRTTILSLIRTTNLLCKMVWSIRRGIIGSRYETNLPLQAEKSLIKYLRLAKRV